jgi:hypothetical protein
MTRTREAFVLPLLFLTVALLGGVRVADRVVLLPPPLFALVLAGILAGVLVKSGALAPDRLVHARRPGLANANGAFVLGALLAAAAQAFNMAIPESGLPRLLFSVFLLVLLINTLAASPDRVRVLRSMLVIFASAFVLKFIVLAALSDPGGGYTKRVLQVLLEGMTFGALSQEVYRPATGYLGFVTLTLFVSGLALLPTRSNGALQGPRRPLLPADCLDPDADTPARQ